MTLFAAVQAPFVREMRTGLERKYRVSVVREMGDEYAYRLRTKVVVPTLPKGAPKAGGNPDLRLDVRLTDYQATTSGHRATATVIGGGEMTVESSGLPSGVDLTGAQGPVWLPFVAFYVPKGDEGPFDLPNVKFGSGLELAGKGLFSRSGGGPKVDIDGTFTVSGRSIGKLTSSTLVDKAGWPEKSTGTLVTENGTFHYTLERA